MVETNTPNPQAQAKTWNMLCHLSAFAGVVIPVGNILAPLVIWLIKKQEMPSVDVHGKESLNFQISMAIYIIAAWLLCFILIGFVLLTVLAIAWIVLVIIASVKANNGEEYKYPLTIRFLK